MRTSSKTSSSPSATMPVLQSLCTKARWYAMTAIAARYVCTARKRSGASRTLQTHNTLSQLDRYPRTVTHARLSHGGASATCTATDLRNGTAAKKSNLEARLVTMALRYAQEHTARARQSCPEQRRQNNCRRPACAPVENKAPDRLLLLRQLCAQRLAHVVVAGALDPVAPAAHRAALEREGQPEGVLDGHLEREAHARVKALREEVRDKGEGVADNGCEGPRAAARRRHDGLPHAQVHLLREVRPDAAAKVLHASRVSSHRKWGVFQENEAGHSAHRAELREDVDGLERAVYARVARVVQHAEAVAGKQPLVALAVEVALEAGENAHARLGEHFRVQAGEGGGGEGFEVVELDRAECTRAGRGGAALRARDACRC